MGIPYWLLREEDRYSLCVEGAYAEAARAELEKFEGERTLRPARDRKYESRSPVPLASLFAFAWILIGSFALQQRLPAWRIDRGVGSSTEILHGEIWRTVTALTLHADGAHLAANLAIGALFAVFLFPLLGTGVTWCLTLCAGALGNWLNAFGHRGETHQTIGASTAVFGALGVLVGCQLIERLSTGRHRRLWEVIVPLGGGAALLAVLGVGQDERIDFMAHFLGLISGVGLGVAAAILRLKERLSSRTQVILALLVPGVVLLAWLCALFSRTPPAS